MGETRKAPASEWVWELASLSESRLLSESRSPLKLALGSQLLSRLQWTSPLALRLMSRLALRWELSLVSRLGLRWQLESRSQLQLQWESRSQLQSESRSQSQLLSGSASVLQPQRSPSPSSSRREPCSNRGTCQRSRTLLGRRTRYCVCPNQISHSDYLECRTSRCDYWRPKSN